jgi:hypothetical protein
MNSFIRWMVVIVSIALASTGAAQSFGVTPAAPFPLPNNVFVQHADRTVLGEDVVHYRYDVRVGPGKFDMIRLHRIVRERSPYRPVQTVNGVLLLPGSPNYFEAIFISPLISQVPSWDHSIVIYLAKNNIDVWGMDYAWSLVPAETTDFAFMKNWGMAKDIQHVQIALYLARLLRATTGQGGAPIEVLGFSYGGSMAYPVAGAESQMPRGLRSIKGMVILDVGMKLKEQADRDVYCSFAAADQANLDAGIYNDDTGVFLKQLSDLAISAPGDLSPNLPGMTNYQAALFFGTSTELLNGQFWHFVGGYLDENGIPSHLRYFEDRGWIDLLGNIPPHFPMRADLDADTMFCGKDKSPFTEHLGQITIPILFAGAAGGWGEKGFYTTTLTASTDVTKSIVQMQSDDQRQQDFGHVDNLLATHAETLVWQPILDWLLTHR